MKYTEILRNNKKFDDFPMILSAGAGQSRRPGIPREYRGNTPAPGGRWRLPGGTSMLMYRMQHIYQHRGRLYGDVYVASYTTT